MKEVKIYVKDSNNSSNENTGILLEQLQKEYDKPRQLVLQLLDAKGQVVSGKCNLIVGTVENGNFLLTGNVDEIFFSKDNDDN